MKVNMHLKRFYIGSVAFNIITIFLLLISLLLKGGVLLGPLVTWSMFINLILSFLILLSGPISASERRVKTIIVIWQVLFWLIIVFLFSVTLRIWKISKKVGSRRVKCVNWEGAPTEEHNTLGGALRAAKSWKRPLSKIFWLCIRQGIKELIEEAVSKVIDFA